MRTLRSTTATPSWPVRLILRAYPPAWRARYEAELAAMLAAAPPAPRQLRDLALGAIDARLHPAALAVPAGALAAGDARGAQPAPSGYGPVPGVPIGELSRRSFLRRMMGAGAVLLSLEFVGGSLAFLWPQIREGIGAKLQLGTVAEIIAAEPRFASGWPYAYAPARLFLVNVPAAEAMARGAELTVGDPSAAQLLALWRTCPHLGCQVPEPCEDVRRFQCRCHGSTFNIVGEKMKTGPAQRGMDRFPVTIDAAGMVIVDTAERIKGPPARAAATIGFDDGRPFDASCFPV